MAVTVEQETPFVVLDEGDRIVGVGPKAESQFGPLVGACLCESFPESEPLFKPCYDEAHRSGEPLTFVQLYDGSVARVRRCRWRTAGSSCTGSTLLAWTRSHSGRSRTPWRSHSSASPCAVAPHIAAIVGAQARV